ncbi:MAG: hypothetical protein WBD09_09585 [Halobacteriota archaeon]
MEKGNKRSRKYLLIISCSKTQSKEKEPIPALRRYDGRIFRSIKELMRRSEFPKAIDIRIISKGYSLEHGLIGPDFPILRYNIEMTDELALRIKPSILSSLKGLLEKEDYIEVAINLSDGFSICVGGIRDLLAQETSLTCMIGTLDERDKQLGEWIEKVKK